MNKKVFPIETLPLLVPSFLFLHHHNKPDPPIKGDDVFRGDQRKEPVMVTLTLTLEVYYQKIHLVIPQASELLASRGRMPMSTEASPGGSLESQRLGIKAIYWHGHLSVSDINTHRRRTPVVVGHCLCSHSPSSGGIMTVAHHMVWSRKCHRMVLWTLPLHGHGLWLRLPCCSDWFRDEHMAQTPPIRVLQGLVCWSVFFAWVLVPGLSLKVRLLAVIFLDQRGEDKSQEEWTELKHGESLLRAGGWKRALSRLWSPQMQPCPPWPPKAHLSHNVPWHIHLFFKATLSWSLSHVTQRVVTSTIPHLNNSFITNKKKGKESSFPKHFSSKGSVDCPEKESQEVRGQ